MLPAFATYYSTCFIYGYDRDSNRTETQESPGSCSGPFTTTATYTYTPGASTPVDALTGQTGPTRSFAYDSDGNMTGRGTDSLVWDGSGRLSGGVFAGTTVAYTYDPTGQLESRSTSNPAATTRYLLGDLYETDGTGTITASYVDGPAGDLALYAGPPTGSTPVGYLYYNAHGDLAATADTAGVSAGAVGYDPFGTPLSGQPANATTHGYVGAADKQTDTAGGLILMGARPYDPSLGRFLSIDPVDGGSLNNYDYAGQNPINTTDPNGEMPIDPGAISAGIDFEDEVISALGLPENREPVEANGNRAIPDAMSRAASIEIKHGAYVYASKQLRTEAAAAKEADQELGVSDERWAVSIHRRKDAAGRSCCRLIGGCGGGTEAACSSLAVERRAAGRDRLADRWWRNAGGGCGGGRLRSADGYPLDHANRRREAIRASPFTAISLARRA